MCTWRSVASHSSSSLSLSSTATSSTSFLSQALISTLPWTFETSTVASEVTAARLVMVCCAAAGVATAATTAAAHSDFWMFISGSTRKAVTRGDDSRIQLQLALVGADQESLQHPARRVLGQRRVDLVGRGLHDLEVLQDRRAGVRPQRCELRAKFGEQLVTCQQLGGGQP